ncbi:polyprenyl synthetase family protein [Curtobacterium flaccumfaciens]|nr:polyprenyl synthetase family protein [Curtobacterium flaccumfaciens]
MSEEAATVAHIGLALVDDCLERFFAVSSTRAARYGRPSEELWRVLRRASLGGKRFRPRMVLTAYNGLGGSDPHAAANVAAAYELLHTALVVHDDVIDRDWSRRGQPNVAGSFRDTGTTGGLPLPTAEHRGMSAAVIAGDLALAAAPRFIDASGVTGDRRARLLDLLDEAVFASAAGEMADVDLALGVMPTVDEVLRMERAKTSVYSFEAPLQSGAVLAGAPEPVVAALGAFGREIGIAYQIVDDLLGCSATRARRASLRSATCARASGPCSSPTPRPPRAGPTSPRTSATQASPRSARPRSAQPWRRAVPEPPRSRASRSTRPSPEPNSPDCPTTSPTTWRTS